MFEKISILTVLENLVIVFKMDRREKQIEIQMQMIVFFGILKVNK